MVRRLVNTKSKPKIVRTTKSEQYLVNKKYMGDEPVFSGQNSTLDYVKALSWYNYMTTTDEAREYLVEYLTKVAAVDDAKRVKKLNDSDVPLTAAFISRMIVRGFQPSEETKKYLWTTVKTSIEKVDVSSNEDSDDTPKVSVQDRMREKLHEILGEVEGLVDDYMGSDKNFSFYDWLSENSIPAVYVNHIIEKLQPVLFELIQVTQNKFDDQLKEGYKYYTKPQIKVMIGFYKSMIDDASRYSSNVKKSRAPRKPRKVSVEKKLKNLKWQKEDATYKIASILPEKIIGAAELWTFNTKYKTITVLRAKDRAGLQIKGTSILNYDETTSKTKGTGRNTEDILKRTLEGGKIVLRKILDGLKTDKALAYRINENTILLRVIN